MLQLCSEKKIFRDPENAKVENELMHSRPFGMRSISMTANYSRIIQLPTGTKNQNHVAASASGIKVVHTEPYESDIRGTAFCV